MKNNIRYRYEMNKTEEEVQFCCSKGEYLFHDNDERSGFMNEKDFFSIYDVS